MSKTAKQSTKGPTGTIEKESLVDTSTWSGESGDSDSSSASADEAYTASKPLLISKLKMELQTLEKSVVANHKNWMKCFKVRRMMSSVQNKMTRQRKLKKTNAMKLYSGYACPFCPWYGVRKYCDSKRIFLRHLRHTHAAHKSQGRSRSLGCGNYIAYGLLQWSIIVALFDLDTYNNIQRDSYLRDSASILRKSSTRPLSPQICRRHILSLIHISEPTRPY